ncbi:unnamed protein product, partial [Rotaria magnacalcarata]
APNPLLWSHLQTPMSSYGHPYFPAYAMDGSLSGYMLNNTEATQPSNSFLNPDAAEWVPLHHGSESSSSDNNILINDEINFP